MRGDLEQHLIQEELLLFPTLLSEDTTKEAATLTPEIIAEHEGAGKILGELRLITHGYTVPNDGCATYEKTYQMLSELEDDLHCHIPLENNILFHITASSMPEKYVCVFDISICYLTIWLLQ